MPTGFPPGPLDWTLVLSQMRKIKRDALGDYTKLHRRYGDVVHLRFGPYHTCVFFHPDAVREVLVAKAKQFRRFPRPRQVLAQWNGNSVLITEGDGWLRQRRMVQPVFHPRRFEGYASCTVARTHHRLDRWLKTIETAGGIETEIGNEMTDLTLEIIAKTIFDAEIGAEFSHHPSAGRSRQRKNLILLIIDPEDEKVWDASNAEELPRVAEKDLAEKFAKSTLMVTALESESPRLQ
jgi:cytochrome P450